MVKACWKVLKPPPRLTISEWADQNRKLSSESSAEPGQWITSRAEYQRGIMDAISDPKNQRVVLMTSAQVGKSEAILNVIGYHISQDPAPILALQPTLEMGETFSKDRVSPMLRDTPCLTNKVADSRSRDSGNTTLHKRFHGGYLAIAGANSPASLASRPVRILLADEVDRYPVSAGSEGDPLTLAIKRTTTFWNRRIVIVSTPTVKGASRIEAEWERSDKRRYHVTCAHCGHEQHLVWSQVQWPEGQPHKACYHCAECGVGWSDPERRAAIRWGRWIATDPEAVGVVGFHLNEIYSPWSTPADMAVAFVAAKQSPETLKAWVNTALGETWEDTGEGVDQHALMARAETWGDAPEGVLLLSCGVDVQPDRLELERVGWGVGEESWSLDHKVIYGDPNAPHVWSELDDYLLTPTRTVDGRTLTIQATAIDTGGQNTQAVYAYCRDRARMRVWAIKGMGGQNKPIWPKKASRNNKGRVNLYLVGVDAAKDMIYARLRKNEPGPGYCHFPTDRDKSWFDQLTAETVKTEFRKGFPVRVWTKPQHARNEGLDCFDPETEVLTARGWQRFANLTGAEELATVNLNNQQIEFQAPTHLIAKPYSGKMVELKGRRLDILVTPNHRMVTFKKEFDRAANKWRFDVPPQITLAKDLTVHHQLMMAADWNPARMDFVTIPAAISSQGVETSPEQQVDAGDMAAFMGWFVAEGCTFTGVSNTQGNRRYRVQLDQNEGPKAEKIRELLAKLPWNFRESAAKGVSGISRRWICTQKQLFDFVQECGTGVESKRVPQWVKDAPADVISRFLDAAILGDGWVQTREGQRQHRTYATVSKVLADDIQELFIKTGCAANIREVEGKPWKINGKTGVDVRTQYHVSECKVRKASLEGGGNGARGYIGKEVDYDGMVYCATVPNGTLICRRNGKSFVAGNCRVYAYAALLSQNVTWSREVAKASAAPRSSRPVDAPEVATVPEMPKTAPAVAGAVSENVRRLGRRRGARAFL